MIRECLGNKGVEKVFRFDAITCDKIQIRSNNFRHVVHRKPSYETKITVGCARTIMGRNKNNINMCNRSSLIMKNYWNCDVSHRIKPWIIEYRAEFRNTFVYLTAFRRLTYNCSNVYTAHFCVGAASGMTESFPL